MQLDHNQLAIVNLGRWEDLQKNVQSAVNKVQAGVKHASNGVRTHANEIVNKAKPLLSQQNSKAGFIKKNEMEVLKEAATKNAMLPTSEGFKPIYILN